MELLELIERMGLLLQSERRRHAARLNLSVVHLDILYYLNRCNRFSNTPLAVSNYLGITKGTISQSIKLLESRGLLEKQVDLEDRRVSHLILKERAIAILQNDTIRIWEGLFGRFPEKDLNVATNLLKDCLEIIQRQHEYRTFGLCHTCRHLKTESPVQYRCGLTGQPLEKKELQKICMEHENTTALES